MKGIINNCLFLQIDEKIEYISKIDTLNKSEENIENTDDDEEYNDDASPKKLTLESSLLNENININSYKHNIENIKILGNRMISQDSNKHKNIESDNNKLLTNADLEKDKFDCEKEEISIINQENHSCSNSDEEKNFQLKEPKSDWIEKFKEEV